MIRKENILKYISEDCLTFGEPMKQHTSFKVGGPAEVFARPQSAKDVESLLRFCREEGAPFFILGRGSNLLVSDAGIAGVVIDMTEALKSVRVSGNIITAEAGASLKSVARKAEESALAGFEFASGIPGTIGGAAFMNAGAYGGEMKDVFKSAEVLTREGKRKTLDKEAMALSYRSSAVEREGYIILSVTIELQKGDSEAIKALSKELNGRRRDKQPLEYPSAGSTFKRPEGYFAGKLIEEAGLKGYSVGGAQVSEKHCGFVINTGKATAKDIVTLIKDISDRVYADAGVRLEPEVRMLGFEKEEMLCD